MGSQWNLTYFEKVAGIFVSLVALSVVIIFLAIGLKKGWFESRAIYFTDIQDSEGLRAGSSVQLAGVRVGEVADIEMNRGQALRVKIEILERYRQRILAGARIQLIRPFVVGEKSLYISNVPGATELLPEHSVIPAEEVIGLTDLLNGKNVTPYVQTLGAIFSQMKEIADILLLNKDSKKIAGAIESLPILFRQLSALSKELTVLGRQLNEGQHVKKVVQGLAKATDALSEGLPSIAESTPKLARDLTVVVSNLAVLTEEIKKTLPMFAAMAPELPKSGQRMVEALDEAVVVLKAMQKSFLLRGSAREVREEEADREKSRLRQPASQDSSKPSGEVPPATQP